MTKVRFVLIKQALLLFVALFSALSSAATFGPTGASCSERVAEAHLYDLTAGAEQVAHLHQINLHIEALMAEGKWNLAAAEKMGVLTYLDAPVTTKPNKNGDVQIVPFKEIRFPFAHTGAYIPTAKKGAPIAQENFDGLAIALPGIGFTGSTAKSLFEIGGTLNKGDNPALEIAANRKIRMITVLLDAPLNGMGEEAPYAFGHPSAVIAVMHHARMIIGALFPNKTTFFIGRSQGGLNVFEYASYYKDVAGVIGVNSSSVDRRIFEGCIHEHEEMLTSEAKIAKAKADGFSCEIHQRSWRAHADYTPLYQYDRRPSLVPVLGLLGTEDHSYPQPLFRELWNAWAQQQNSMRRMNTYIGGGHNLWMRPKGEGAILYGNVIGDMARFFARHTPHLQK